jgi:hypothetical protein
VILKKIYILLQLAKRKDKLWRDVNTLRAGLQDYKYNCVARQCCQIPASLHGRFCQKPWPVWDLSLPAKSFFTAGFTADFIFSFFYEKYAYKILKHTLICMYKWSRPTPLVVSTA